MKVKAYTIIEFSVGNVIAGHSEVIEAKAVYDRGDCYEVVIHENRTRLYSKKYWNVETL